MVAIALHMVKIKNGNGLGPSLGLAQIHLGGPGHASGSDRPMLGAKMGNWPDPDLESQV